MEGNFRYNGGLEIELGSSTLDEQTLFELFLAEAGNMVRARGSAELLIRMRTNSVMDGVGDRRLILRWGEAKPRRYGGKKTSGLMFYLRNWWGNLFSARAAVKAEAQDKAEREAEAAKLADFLESAKLGDSMPETQDQGMAQPVDGRDEDEE
jgi:hypothetical protein